MTIEIRGRNGEIDQPQRIFNVFDPDFGNLMALTTDCVDQILPKP